MNSIAIDNFNNDLNNLNISNSDKFGGVQKSKGPLDLDMQGMSFEDKEASLDQKSQSPSTKKRQITASEKRKRMRKSKTTQNSQNSKLSEYKKLTVAKE